MKDLTKQQIDDIWLAYEHEKLSNKLRLEMLPMYEFQYQLTKQYTELCVKRLIGHN